MKTTFEKVGLNVPFRFTGSGDTNEPVCVKIDEARYIVIGQNGAYPIEFRETSVYPLN